MIYLDNGATSFRKPPSVYRAVREAFSSCANPGRGGYEAAMAAEKQVFETRRQAARLFHCLPEQAVFTFNCTHGLNMAIRTLVKPGDRVVISGFEHNAVTRPLHGLKARVTVAGRRLFDWDDTLEEFEKALRSGVDAAVFTHVSNVFGYILPVEELAAMCRTKGVPFVIDAAQSAGIRDIDFPALGADFLAMPGHKGLLGPQGTGLLLCARQPEPLLLGGTGTDSIAQQMPDYLPEGAEAGTLNVPGIAGLGAGLRYLNRWGLKAIRQSQTAQARRCAQGLQELGFRVFSGKHQAGTVSFLPPGDCEEAAAYFAAHGIALRSGLHCAPLAHESAGTLDTGTVRLSFGHDAAPWQTEAFLDGAKGLLHRGS